MTEDDAPEPPSTVAHGPRTLMPTSDAADAARRRWAPRRGRSPRHRKNRPGISLPQAFMAAGSAYVLLGTIWFALWVTAGEPAGLVRQVWGFALIAPLAAVEALLAARLANGPLWRYVIAQSALLVVGLAAAWVGTVGGALLAWFVVWTALEPRVIGFVGFWWTVRAVTWPWARKRWTAAA